MTNVIEQPSSHCGYENCKEEYCKNDKCLYPHPQTIEPMSTPEQDSDPNAKKSIIDGVLNDHQRDLLTLFGMCHTHEHGHNVFKCATVCADLPNCPHKVVPKGWYEARLKQIKILQDRVQSVGEKPDMQAMANSYESRIAELEADRDRFAIGLLNWSMHRDKPTPEQIERLNKLLEEYKKTSK